VEKVTRGVEYQKSMLLYNTHAEPDNDNLKLFLALLVFALASDNVFNLYIFKRKNNDGYTVFVLNQ
jgi:hypothetical protein